MRSPATSFVGRARELSELAALVRESQLVVVCGPPGVGKTRLARELATQVAMPHVVAELAEAATIEQASAAVALSLPPADRTNADVGVEAIAARLSGAGELLVVLDSFDLLVRAGAPMLTRWLEAAPAARFVVTSGTPPGLAGEVVFELGPLALPDLGGTDAVDLFVQRARAARAGRPLGERELADVKAIVRELDGLPLAIELSAPLLRVMTTAQILSSLRAQLGQAAPPRAGLAAPGDAVLATMLDASWQLLDPREQAVLAQVSVFAGGFSPEAVARVVRAPGAEGPTEALAGLRSLRDRSLVVAYEPSRGPAELRFRLYSVVRAYAAEKLGPDETAAARERLARWLLDEAEQWRRRIEQSGDDEAAGRLGLELENLGVVHRWALIGAVHDRGRAQLALRAASLLAFALESMGGGLGIPGGLLDEALPVAVTAGADPGLLAGATLQRVRSRWHEGQKRGLDGEAGQALQWALAAGRRDLAAQAEATLCLLAVEEGDERGAHDHERRALAQLGDAPDAAAETAVLERLVAAYLSENRLEDVARLLRRLLKAHRAAGHLVRECRTTTNLATCAVEMGDLAGARSAAERAIALARELSSPLAEGFAHLVLGQIAHEQGRLPDARESIGRAIDVARELGRRSTEAEVNVYLAMVELEASELDAARRVLDAVLVDDATDVEHEVLALSLLAVTHAARDRIADAEAALARAEARAAPRPHLARVVDACRGHLNLAEARAAARAGDATAAGRHRAAASARLGAEHVAWRPFAERVAQRLLRRALAQEHELARAEDRPAALVVGPGWFRAPGGASVDIRRRRVLRHVLEELVDRRVAAPGATVSVSQLFDKAWSGQSVSPELAAGRVYAALSTLRRLGLQSVLLSNGEGYLLDPAVPVERAGAV